MCGRVMHYLGFFPVSVISSYCCATMLRSQAIYKNTKMKTNVVGAFPYKIMSMPDRRVEARR